MKTLEPYPQNPIPPFYQDPPPLYLQDEYEEEEQMLGTRYEVERARELKTAESSKVVMLEFPRTSSVLKRQDFPMAKTRTPRGLQAQLVFA